ncbi:MAG: hypothetical protein SGBAC_007447 [Bacillariaceae sp.]
MFFASKQKEEEKEQEECKTLSTEDEDESFEVSFSSHASYVKEREYAEYHAKIKAAESYDRRHADEDEKDSLEEETHVDTIKRMRAKRLAAEKGQALEEHRIKMELADTDAEADTQPISNEEEEIFESEMSQLVSTAETAVDLEDNGSSMDRDEGQW